MMMIMMNTVLLFLAYTQCKLGHLYVYIWGKKEKLQQIPSRIIHEFAEVESYDARFRESAPLYIIDHCIR